MAVVNRAVKYGAVLGRIERKLSTMKGFERSFPRSQNLRVPNGIPVLDPVNIAGLIDVKLSSLELWHGTSFVCSGLIS
jgi:hypothetical protein